MEEFKAPFNLKKAPWRTDCTFYSIDDWFYTYPEYTFNARLKKRKSIFSKIVNTLIGV